MSEHIKCLFEPESVAIIGASHNPGKIGYTILNNLITGGYKGRIYPVNPAGGEILGCPVYRSLKEIKGDIDVASLAIPAKYCLDAVRDCAEKGVKNIQIISSGFSEIGNHKEEYEIVRIAKSAGMRVLGPNIFGVFSAESSMNLTFSATRIKEGNVAILTQSGALGIAMIGRTVVDNMGLSVIVSTGNKCDIDEAELLEYLGDHKKTRVILIYIEGVKEGERLLQVLGKTALKKPVIIIKAGRSKRGAMAAASHTGSLAGLDAIFDSVIKQCGALRAESLEEAFNWCRFLSFAPEPSGKNTVIVTNGGGIGVLATDACEKYNIELFDDQRVLQEYFEKATPSFGSTRNPIDITGGARAGDYKLALTAPVACEHIDSTLTLYCETAVFDSDNLVPMVRSTYEQHLQSKKPVSYAIVGGESVEKAIHELNRQNLPVFRDVEPAVSCMGALYRYSEFKNRPRTEDYKPDINFEEINTVIDKAMADGRSFLLADEAQAVMNASGIQIPASMIATDIQAAIDASNSIGYPVVMKVVSKDIIHKSDAGGLALDLENREEVIEAYEAIMKNCREYDSRAHITGVEIAEMVRPGLEMVVGAVRDAAFGPVVMCGLGGVYVEVLKDVAFRSYPLDAEEAGRMLREIKSYSLLLGVRGEKKKDINGVTDIILKVGAILSGCGRITDIEINPVVVYEESEGNKALDIRILLRKQGD
ncbi:MAG: acetate--CoA ligase family protein [Balneolales bacterium]